MLGRILKVVENTNRPWLPQGTEATTVSPSPCRTADVNLAENQLAAVRAVSAPGMTPGAGAMRYAYNREPYGRAHIPTALGVLVVDGKVLMTERGPLMEFWRDCDRFGILDVFIPGTWLEPILRGESEWRHCYDVLEGR